jgi:hypothetical protein
MYKEEIMKIINDMIVEGKYIIANNVRKEGTEIVADGLKNYYLDENGNEYKKIEYIITEDGDCVTIK